MNKSNSSTLRSSTPFMSENHPLNPYGNNFIDHPYESKLFYKFNQVKQYVHMEENDSYRVSLYSFYFFGGVTGALLGSIGGFHLLQKFLFKPYYQHIHTHLDSYKHLYLGVMVASSVTFAYSSLTSLYITNVARPLLYKYLDQAIKNGFHDYEISFKEEQ